MKAMRDGILEAVVEPDPKHGSVVRSPGVGIYRGHPRTGGRRSAGDSIGTLTVLNRTQDVFLPANVDGLVADLRINDRAVPVEYGQVLFRLDPMKTAAAGAKQAPRGRASAGAEALPEDCHAVTSPIDGVFYRRSSPTADVYVEKGSVVESGRTLGLIEAMKSFNAVNYGGPGLPDPAVIVEVRAADAAEVRQGAILFVVRAAS